MSETLEGTEPNQQVLKTLEGAKRCKQKPLLRTLSLNREIFGLLCIKIEEAPAIWNPTFSRKTNKLRIPLRGHERGSLIPWPT